MIPKFILKSVFYTCILLQVMVSCNKNNSSENLNKASKQETFEAPIVVPAKKFIVNNLGKFPAPEITLLSQKPAPTKIEAGFYANMQNFNTEDGLALGTLLSGYKDKKGNLWFGTSGNGVSKYDGKTFTNFNSNFGLIHNQITCITQDSKENIWFGTSGGVSKYDGVNFENFTMEQGLPSISIVKIVEGKNGNLWIATSGGLSKYTPPKKGENPNQKPFTNFTKKDGLVDEIISDIISDNDGNLWISGENGIFKLTISAKNEISFNDETSSFGLGKNEIRSLNLDQNGNIWATSNGIISKYNPTKNSHQLFTKNDGLLNTLYTNSFCDRAGNLWFGSKNGVLKYDQKTKLFQNFTIAEGLSDNDVRSIIEDNSGSIWFATFGGGICRYDGESVISYNNKQGLPGKSVYAAVEGKNGNIWLAPSGAGIVKFDINTSSKQQKIFTNYTSKQGLKNGDIYTAFADNSGNVWFGGSGGIFKINENSIINYTTKQGLASENINSLNNDKEGNLWIGTYDAGVCKFDGKSFTNFSTDEGLVHKTVWSICEDTDGIIWIATRGGLSRYDPKFKNKDGSEGVFMNFKKVQGLPDSKLSTVFQDRFGNIIIGSWGGGLSVIKKERAKKLFLPNAEQSKEPIFENFSSSNGLPNDIIYGVIEDKIGNLIVGTSEGLTIFKGGIKDGFKNINKNNFDNFNIKTGYPIKDISNNHSLMCDEKGVIWAGTGDKLVRFDYSKVHQNKKPIKVEIQQININNEKTSWRSLQNQKLNSDQKGDFPNAIPASITDELLVFGRKLSSMERDSLTQRFKDIEFDTVSAFNNLPENLSLPYKDNNISFEFNGNVTTRGNLVNYLYKLEGYDKHWSPITNKTSANFGNIKEGEYTFLVKAKMGANSWGEPTAFHFKIKPPLERTWLAYFIYFLLFLGLLYAIDKYQRSRIMIKERQRNLQKDLEKSKEIETAYIELKNTQTQLIHAEKMASLGELSAGIAHEIQNPLNFVMNFSEVSSDLLEEMKEELKNGKLEDVNDILKDVQENLLKINHHGKRADDIVKGMLQHSRSSTGKLEPTDINQICDEYLRLSYHGLRAKDKSFNATLSTDFDETIGKIKLISQDFGRVVLNLLTNAFYAVNEKQHLNIENYKPTVSISTKKEKDKIVIKISDNGNGMPQEVIDKIFLPFFTTKPAGKGTGLGLSISYDIITTGHNGELKVESTENEGTKFKIILPI